MRAGRRRLACASSATAALSSFSASLFRASARVTATRAFWLATLSAEALAIATNASAGGAVELPASPCSSASAILAFSVHAGEEWSFRIFARRARAASTCEWHALSPSSALHFTLMGFLQHRSLTWTPRSWGTVPSGCAVSKMEPGSKRACGNSARRSSSSIRSSPCCDTAAASSSDGSMRQAKRRWLVALESVCAC